MTARTFAIFYVRNFFLSNVFLHFHFHLRNSILGMLPNWAYITWMKEGIYYVYAIQRVTMLNSNYVHKWLLSQWMNWNELNLNANILIPYIPNKHTHAQTCDNGSRSCILYEHTINICMMPNMLHAIYMLKSMFIIEKGALLFRLWTKHEGDDATGGCSRDGRKAQPDDNDANTHHMIPCFSLAGVS